MIEALKKIRDEHARMAAVVSCIKETAINLEFPPKQESIDRLYYAIFYIKVFPERYHHPNEEKYFFPVLKRKSDELCEIINDLESEHEKGFELVYELDKTLSLIKDGDRKSVENLKMAAKAYCEFCFSHMTTEENLLFSVAEELLNSDDWVAIEEAFSCNNDPIFNNDFSFAFADFAESLST